jgi:hypothetical protein
MGGKDIMDCSPGILDFVRITKGNARGGTPEIPDRYLPGSYPPEPVTTLDPEWLPDPEDGMYPATEDGLLIIGEQLIPDPVDDGPRPPVGLPGSGGYLAMATPTNVPETQQPQPLRIVNITVDTSGNSDTVYVPNDGALHVVTMPSSTPESFNLIVIVEELALAVVEMPSGEQVHLSDAMNTVTLSGGWAVAAGNDTGGGTYHIDITKGVDGWTGELTQEPYDAGRLQVVNPNPIPVWENPNPYFRGEALYHFPMNEGSGDRIYEVIHGDGSETGSGGSTGFGEDIAWSGYTLHGGGQAVQDRSLHFLNGDGTVFLPDYVTLVGQQQYSIEFLVHLTNGLWPEYDAFIVWLDGCIQFESVAHFGPSGGGVGGIRVRVYGESVDAQMNTFRLGDLRHQPIHIVLTWDGNYLRLYANGAICGKVQFPVPPYRDPGFETKQNQIGYPLYLGGNFISTEGFQGYINHLTIRGHAMSSSEVYNHAFEFMGNDIVRNWADRAARVLVTGNLTFEPYSRLSRSRLSRDHTPTSMRFETLDDYLEVDVYNPLTNDFGISLSVNLDDVSGQQFLYVTPNFSIFVEDGLLSFANRLAYDGLGETVTADPADLVEAGEWVEFKIVRESAQLYLYVNDMDNHSAQHYMPQNFNAAGDYGWAKDRAQIMGAKGYLDYAGSGMGSTNGVFQAPRLTEVDWMVVNPFTGRVHTGAWLAVRVGGRLFYA